MKQLKWLIKSKIRNKIKSDLMHFKMQILKKSIQIFIINNRNHLPYKMIISKDTKLKQYKKILVNSLPEQILQVR